MSDRDDFTNKTKEILAKRVGFRCSNPNCRKLTIGPQEKEEGIINVGVASHITGASKNGPRFDSQISSSERISIDNGIWLCQTCSKLIDSDITRYSQDLLNEWKKHSEKAVLLELESSISPNVDIQNDKEIIKFFSVCFDRPAFQDYFNVETNIINLKNALEDTVFAINTGVLRDRKGIEIKNNYGKSYLNNPKWRTSMDNIVDLLRSMIIRLNLLFERLKQKNKDDRQIHIYYLGDRSLGNWIDSTRTEIINIFNSICKEVNISPLKFPSSVFRYLD